ncbi:MAG: hypothetical protein ACRDTT_08345 [Pseudonocardiaceae bacterium]
MSLPSYLRGLAIDAVQRRLVDLGAIRDRAAEMRNWAVLGSTREAPEDLLGTRRGAL